MLKILGQSQGNIIAIKVVEHFAKTDYRALLPIIVNRHNAFKQIKWYIEIESFTEDELKRFINSLRSEFEYNEKFVKIAMAVDEKWQNMISTFVTQTTGVRFFSLGDNVSAFNWLKS
ncbi:STAS/SEC14 domain-containing protein [Niabella beijingensis]|uniref:STAS/SEC14 domain-containing protein n=1 Tax=Niabella beijingensis TaxID=2872700 RepID=UPI001CC03DA9|nr:STAS/SEC14 domain-containing protein [Niabella beijingensis]MBZ4188913.1 STAS/SEC14 domain-containing protein [Niabella beijingensis]